ncbi:MAG TPA: YCF48-related protein [Steroidobacteraceae bacterium]|nr:YCF48-related protein [Steroidobacteraceae bacterium]
MKPLRLMLLAAVCVWLSGTASSPAVAPSQPLIVKLDRVILMDLARAGGRLLAVGERGTVLLSDDAGRRWSTEPTPVTRTLTAVVVDEAKVAVAVGHGPTLIRSEDGGQHWTQIPLPEAGTDSLLAITLLGPGHFIAYGGYGLYFDSQDSGKTWQRRQVIAEDFDRHISQVIAVGQSLLLVGESGTLARSDDGGLTYKKLPSPYAGSFFGALLAKDGVVLAFGMRGNVYRSSDVGATWTKVESGTTAAFNGGKLLANGDLLLVGNSGLMAVSHDNGVTLHTSFTPAGKGITQAVELADGTLIGAGESGISVLDRAILK